MIELLLAADLWIHDLGRRTPFGRTFDVYIETDGRPPHAIGSTWRNSVEPRGFEWIIDGDLFRNRNEATYPWLENCPECVAYFEARTAFGDYDGVPCSEPGVYWSCIQSNPYQRWGYFGHRSFPVDWRMEGCCPNFGSGSFEKDLPFFWADSWIMVGSLDQPNGNPNNQERQRPIVQRQHRDLLDDDAFKAWDPYDEPQGLQCCQSASQVDSGWLIRFAYDVAWESETFENSFRIARITGADRFKSEGVVQFACGQSYSCDPEPYSVEFIADNSCPSDLNEDGIVGFADLLKVLGDVAAYKYHPQTNHGFNAILKVLAEWGEC